MDGIQHENVLIITTLAFSKDFLIVFIRNYIFKIDLFPIFINIIGIKIETSAFSDF